MSKMIHQSIHQNSRQSDDLRCKIEALSKMEKKDEYMYFPLWQPRLKRLYGSIGRNQIADHLIRVVDYFGEDRDIVEFTINYLDRYLLSSSAPIDSASPYLSIYTCLHIAIKAHSSFSCRLKEGSFTGRAVYTGLKSLVKLSGGVITEFDIKAKEMKVIHTLHYHVNTPTSFAYIRHFFALSIEEEISKLAISAKRPTLSPSDHISTRPFQNFLRSSLFQAELALCDDKLALCRPSVVARAAVRNSVRMFKEENQSQCEKGSLFRTLNELLQSIDDVADLQRLDDSYVSKVENILYEHVQDFFMMIQNYEEEQSNDKVGDMHNYVTASRELEKFATSNDSPLPGQGVGSGGQKRRYEEPEVAGDEISRPQKKKSAAGTNVQFQLNVHDRTPFLGKEE